MKFFYDDNEPRDGFNPGLVSRLNPTKQWLKHYGQQLELNFFMVKGERLERYQARKEMLICERKLQYWSKRPGFDHKEAMAGAEALKKMWQGR